MKLGKRLAATLGVTALITAGSAVNAFAIIPVGGCPNWNDFRIVRVTSPACYAYTGSMSVNLPLSYGASSGINAGYFIRTTGEKTTLKVQQKAICFDCNFTVNKVAITWAP